MADSWGDGKLCRSFLQYYPEYWNVIGHDLIFFSGLDERREDNQCV